jgi:hypothetical protein
MDIAFLIAAGALWAAMVALALGCEHLQNRKVAP